MACGAVCDARAARGRARLAAIASRRTQHTFVSTERSKQLKEKTKVKGTTFNSADLCKNKTAKDKGVESVQPTWAPNIPKSKSTLPSIIASLKRPVSDKSKKDTDLAEDAVLLRQVASVAAEGAVLFPDHPARCRDGS